MNYYTADPHFGHERIIEFCHRPFQNAAEMDAAILATYRSKVTPIDDLWIVGDLAVYHSREAQHLEAMLASFHAGNT